MNAASTWLQFLLIWLPVWGLYTTLILSAHPGASVANASANGLWAIGTASLLSIGVRRLAVRLPWPHPFRPGFALIHFGGALLYASLFASLGTVGQQLLAGAPGRALSLMADHLSFVRFMVMGLWFYVMVTSIVYATQSTARAARAEAAAARSQLLALRSQLNPHFLFNALHTVVQLIPREPARAAGAAERLAGLLRSAIEEDRDLVPLGEELAFVERYLDLERTRFGDRLSVRIAVPDSLHGAMVPAFAVQTLVENAVRHGAGPRVEPTEVVIGAATAPGNRLIITVGDNGAGAAAGTIAASTGTGLRRLRERLEALFGTEGQVAVVTAPDAGCTVTLTVPLRGDD